MPLFPYFFRRGDLVNDLRSTSLPLQFVDNEDIVFAINTLFLFLLQGLGADIGPGDGGPGLVGDLDEIIEFLASKYCIRFILHCVEVYVDVDVILPCSFYRSFGLDGAAPTAVH